MATVDHIDQVLMASISDRWAKSAMVVARAMSQLTEVDDVLFQQRLISLANRGLIETAGDMSQMRNSEVRLKQDDR